MREKFNLEQYLERLEKSERILSPNCCGVIFFISESLFLSKSANMEIDLVCGEDGVRKNYFCVNLSQEQPKGILKTIMRMDDQVLDNAGLDMDRIGTLARAFSDKQTFLYHFEAEHRKKLLEQINDQFDVMDAGEKKSFALIDVEKIPPLSQVALQENTVITFGKKSYKFVEK